MLSRYEEYLKLMNYSDKTIKNYLYNINFFVNYIKTVKNLDSPIIFYNIKREDMLNYMAYLNCERENSSTTRRNKFYAIKSFYEWLSVSYGIANPLDNINFTVLYKRLPKALSVDQAKALINYYEDERNRLIIYLFLNTGMRLSELVNIEIKDIYDDYVVVRGKGNKFANVYLNKTCQKMINDYLKGRKDGMLFNLQNRRVQSIIENALKGLGYEGFSTHSLRHTAATLMYQKTHDILLVKKFLRHDSLAATQIYVHLDDNSIRNAVNNNPLANFGI